MDLLEKQLSRLSDQIDGATSAIRNLYRRLDLEQNPSVREELKERIKKLEIVESALSDRCKQLEDKLQLGGMPFKA